MEIATHLYFIVLIFRKSDLSTFIWYFLLISNLLMFVLLIQFNKSLVSKINAAHENAHKNHSQRFSGPVTDPMPIIIPRIESIGRQHYNDVLGDGFNFNKFNSSGENSGNKLGSVSNFISIKRRLQDVRKSGCFEKSYDRKQLPKASIVVIFCNELLTFVLRTVWSIILQTPADLLQEIILISL